MDVAAAKRDLAVRTGRGIHNVLAAVLLWSVFGVLGLVLHGTFARALVYLFGAGTLFPLGLLVGRLLRLDAFAKGNPLGVLAGTVGGMQLLFAPLMVGALFASPTHVPWYLAVLVGAHFLPFAWVFESRSYGAGAAGVSLTAGLTGWLWPQHTFVVTPFAVAGVLALMALGLLAESRRAAPAATKAGVRAAPASGT
jgi:hypothetical protein